MDSEKDKNKFTILVNPKTYNALMSYALEHGNKSVSEAIEEILRIVEIKDRERTSENKRKER